MIARFKFMYQNYHFNYWLMTFLPAANDVVHVAICTSTDIEHVTALVTLIACVAVVKILNGFQ